MIRSINVPSVHASLFGYTDGMNIQSPTPLTDEDFLRWNEGREGKREFVRGRVLELTGGTLRHAEIMLNLAMLLKQSVSDVSLRVTAAEFGVRTPAGIRYPDAVLHRHDGNGRALATSEPVMVAEILSPSSLSTDFGEKAMEYTALPSLLHYLVLSQDEPRAWLWSRKDGAFSAPEMLVGSDAIVTLTGLDPTLALSEIYRGIA